MTEPGLVISNKGNYRSGTIDDDYLIVYNWGATYDLPIKYLYLQNVQDVPWSERTKENVLPLSRVVQYIYNQSSQQGISLDLILIQVAQTVNWPKNEYNDLIMYYSYTIGYQPVNENGNYIRADNLKPEYVQLGNQILSGANKYIEFLDKSTYIDLDLFNRQYANWFKSLRRRVEYFKKELENIVKTQNSLLELQPNSRTIFYISDTTLATQPTWNGRTPDANDGYDIFNESVVSEPVPYIRYNSTSSDPENYPDKVIISFRQPINRLVPPVFAEKIDGARHNKIDEKPERSLFKVYPDSSGKFKSSRYDIQNYISDNVTSYTEVRKRGIKPPKSKNQRQNRIYIAVLPKGWESKSMVDYVTAQYHLRSNILTVVLPSSKQNYLIASDEDTEKTIDYNENRESITSKISSALPITINSWENVKINGVVYYPRIDIDIYSFLLALIIDPFLSMYLYIDETNKPAALKKRIIIHYRPPLEKIGLISDDNLIAKIKITLIQKYATGQEIFQILTSTDNRQHQDYRLDVGDPYLMVKLFDIPSQAEANRISDLLAYLFRHYMIGPRENLMNYYQQMIPGLYTEDKASQKVVTISRALPEDRYSYKQGDKLKMLKASAPHIFIEKYANNCQLPNQPIPIRQDDIPVWLDTKFEYKAGGEIEIKTRQVMAYPPNNPEIYLVCPSDKYPFPGVKPSSLENSDKYPYVPCCFSTDQMTPGSSSAYNDYVLGKLPTKQRKKGTKYVLKTIRRLAPETYGVIPKNLSVFFNLFEPNTNYQRIGMPTGPNSILHAILIASGDIGYVNSYINNPSAGSILNARDEYVQKVRNNIMGSYNSIIRPEIMLQENFDQDLETIYSDFNDQSVYLDSYRHYRALEEYFNINIFVFTTCSTGKGLIEIPRHKNVYIRIPQLVRPTVMIYKHPYSKNRRGGFNEIQFEPIIQTSLAAAFGQDRRLNPNLNSSLIMALYQMFYYLLETTQWNLVDNMIVSSKFNNQTNYYNLLQRQINTDWSTSLTSQMIDDYGKARGFIVSIHQLVKGQYHMTGQHLIQTPTNQIYAIQEGQFIELSNKHVLKLANNQLTDISTGSVVQLTPQEIGIIAPPTSQFLVITQPSQPYNFKLWTIDSEDHIIQPTYKQLITWFSLPITSVTHWNSMVDGLWFGRDGQDLFYVPIQPTDDNFDVKSKLVSYNPFRRSKQPHNQLQRMNNLHKTNLIILSLIEWVYNLSNMSLDQFVQTYLSRGKGNSGDSDSIYDISSMPVKLPNIETVEQAMQHIKDNSTNVIIDDRFYIYSPKYLSGVIYFLRDYSKNNKGLIKRNMVGGILPGIFDDVSDFEQRPGNLVFLNKTDLLNWIEYRRRKQRRSDIIYTRLEQNFILFIGPYLFEDSDGVSYIIQNVSSVIDNIDTRMITLEDDQDHPSEVCSLAQSQIQAIRKATLRESQQRATQQRDYTLRYRALAVALEWQKTKTNSGYYTEGLICPVDSTKLYPLHILYRISSGSRSHMAENSDPTTQFNTYQDYRLSNPLKVLSYDNGCYAAMLPL